MPLSAIVVVQRYCAYIREQSESCLSFHDLTTDCQLVLAHWIWTVNVKVKSITLATKLQHGNHCYQSYIRHQTCLQTPPHPPNGIRWTFQLCQNCLWNFGQIGWNRTAPNAVGNCIGAFVNQPQNPWIYILCLGVVLSMDTCKMYYYFIMWAFLEPNFWNNDMNCFLSYIFSHLRFPCGCWWERVSWRKCVGRSRSLVNFFSSMTFSSMAILS